MKKTTALGKAALWALLILIFPVASGAVCVICALNPIQTRLVQGMAMLLALLPPLVTVWLGKWHWWDIGFGKPQGNGVSLLPALVIFLPAAVKGFVFDETVWGDLYLFAAVGLAEEIYFRGIIPGILGRAFSKREILWVSTLIFGLGHGTLAFSGAGGVEVLLTILNALIFGLLAMEMVMLYGNILPVVLTHFFFDFETKITPLTGPQLLTAELVRGCLMVLVAVCFWQLVKKEIP